MIKISVGLNIPTLQVGILWSQRPMALSRIFKKCGVPLGLLVTHLASETGGFISTLCCLYTCLDMLTGNTLLYTECLSINQNDI